MEMRTFREIKEQYKNKLTAMENKQDKTGNKSDIIYCVNTIEAFEREFGLNENLLIGARNRKCGVLANMGDLVECLTVVALSYKSRKEISVKLDSKGRKKNDFNAELGIDIKFGNVVKKNSANKGCSSQAILGVVLVDNKLEFRYMLKKDYQTMVETEKARYLSGLDTHFKVEGTNARVNGIKGMRPSLKTIKLMSSISQNKDLYARYQAKHKGL